MIIKIRTLRKPLYLRFILVLIIKYSRTYGGGLSFNNHRWVLPGSTQPAQDKNGAGQNTTLTDADPSTGCSGEATPSETIGRFSCHFGHRPHIIKCRWKPFLKITIVASRTSSHFLTLLVVLPDRRASPQRGG